MASFWCSICGSSGLELYGISQLEQGYLMLFCRLVRVQWPVNYVCLYYFRNQKYILSSLAQRGLIFSAAFWYCRCWCGCASNLCTPRPIAMRDSCGQTINMQDRYRVATHLQTAHHTMVESIARPAARADVVENAASRACEVWGLPSPP